jgi:predicted membrane GTPase involved in stress response
MVVGENMPRENDLTVNVCKNTKLSTSRSRMPTTHLNLTPCARCLMTL